MTLRPHDIPGEPKPTDSEQLETWMKSLGCTRIFSTNNKTGWSLPQHTNVIYDDEILILWQAIQERDQQRLSAALEALPKKQDEHPIDPETGAAVEVYGYEATFNQAIDQCENALTAALGPDNSNDT